MKNTHILIVDDDPDFSSSLSLILFSRGYRTSVADNGAQALDLLRKRGEQDDIPDLVLTDLMMPVMDGIALMDQMTREEIPVPVAVITGYDDLENLERLKRRGLHYVLHKPFDVRELLEFLRGIIPNDWHKEPEQ